VTVDAVTGTVSCAWSCRGAEFASTAPRSHEDVPSALPQPKLKSGAPPVTGDACSWTVASGTFPPVVQTLTVHWAECPRSLLACALAISTQRLTCAGSGTALAPLCGLVLVLVGVGVGVPVTVRVGVGAALAVALGVALTVALGVALAVALEVAGVADGFGLAEVLTMARL
jgi:hypothetical protein